MATSDNFIKMPTALWTLFSQLLYANLNARVSKTSAGYVKSISESNGQMTVTLGDDTTHTIAVGGNVPTATSSTAGITKIYSAPGENTDGAMTQAAIKAAIDSVQNVLLARVQALEARIGTVYTYKGSVETYANLPTSGNSTGDVYNVQQADSTHGIMPGANVAWVEAETNASTGVTVAAHWDVLGGTVDTSTFWSKNEMRIA